MVCIGVAGHRILTELDKIKGGVDVALRRLEETFREQPWSVISALADGADRLAVDRVLTRRAARLIVPLPLARSDYMTDFRSLESREEFLRLLKRANEVIELPPAHTRTQAYEAANDYVIDHCDVLVAIWDGRPEQGEGTASVVAKAQARGLPIAWVHAGNRKPGTTEPTWLGEEQGAVTFENF